MGVEMDHDLRFALLFNFSAGLGAALEAVRSSLPEAESARGALVFKNNVLNFEKNPLRGEVDERFEHQLSAFPLREPDVEAQRHVFHAVLEALRGVAGEVDVLAEPELLGHKSQ
jgi:hypothetical protein